MSIVTIKCRKSKVCGTKQITNNESSMFTKMPKIQKFTFTRNVKGQRSAVPKMPENQSFVVTNKCPKIKGLRSQKNVKNSIVHSYKKAKNQRSAVTKKC